MITILAAMWLGGFFIGFAFGMDNKRRVIGG